MEFSEKEMIDRILNLLQERQINGREFGRRLGMNHSSVSEWRHGKSAPSVETLFKISKYFQVSLDYLVKGTPNAEDSLRIRLETKREKDLLEKYRQLPDKLKESTDNYVDTLIDATFGTLSSVKGEKNVS